MTREDVTLILEKPYSAVPADKHLTVVLAKNYKGEFVTWLYNSAPKCAGLCHGHYFHAEAYGNSDTAALKHALEDYEGRGVKA